MVRVKEILKEKGITLQELAKSMGVSRQSLSRQVNGSMYVQTAQRIADALEVPLWHLFEDPGKHISKSTSENVLFVCPHCGKRLKIEKAE